MDHSSLANILYTRIEELDFGCRSFGCRSILSQHMETKRIIRACGHDTSELEQAIDAANKAWCDLEDTRKKVVERFKVEGICFMVDAEKRKELELTELQ